MRTRGPKTNVSSLEREEREVRPYSSLWPKDDMYFEISAFIPRWTNRINYLKDANFTRVSQSNLRF